MRPDSFRGFGPVGTNGPESFDAVVAEMRMHENVSTRKWVIKEWADRLQSAHAAEVGKYKVAWEEFSERTEWVQQTAKPKELGLHRADVLRLRIEQAEARADAAMGLLREYRSAPKFGDDKTIRATLAIEDHIDAFLAQQALAGGERKE